MHRIIPWCWNCYKTFLVWCISLIDTVAVWFDSKTFYKKKCCFLSTENVIFVLLFSLCKKLRELNFIYYGKTKDYWLHVSYLINFCFYDFVKNMWMLSLYPFSFYYVLWVEQNWFSPSTVVACRWHPHHLVMCPN